MLKNVGLIGNGKWGKVLHSKQEGNSLSDLRRMKIVNILNDPDNYYMARLVGCYLAHLHSRL